MKKIEIEKIIRRMSPSELQNLSVTIQLIGQVIFDSSFIEPIVSGNFSFIGLVIGTVSSSGLFYLSFLFAKKTDAVI